MTRLATTTLALLVALAGAARAYEPYPPEVEEAARVGRGAGMTVQTHRDIVSVAWIDGGLERTAEFRRDASGVHFLKRFTNYPKGAHDLGDVDEDVTPREGGGYTRAWQRYVVGSRKGTGTERIDVDGALEFANNRYVENTLHFERGIAPKTLRLSNGTKIKKGTPYASWRRSGGDASFSSRAANTFTTYFGRDGSVVAEVGDRSIAKPFGFAAGEKAFAYHPETAARFAQSNAPPRLRDRARALVKSAIPFRSRTPAAPKR